jgi:hypothetical protein
MTAELHCTALLWVDKAQEQRLTCLTPAAAEQHTAAQLTTIQALRAKVLLLCVPHGA